MSQVFTKCFIKIVSPSKPESRDETSLMWEGKEAKLIHGLSIRLLTLWTTKAGSFWPLKSHVGCSAPLIIYLSDRRGWHLFTGFHHPLLQDCSVSCNSLRLPDCTGVSATVSEMPWGGMREMAGSVERRGGRTGFMRVPHVQLHA